MNRDIEKEYKKGIELVDSNKHSKLDLYYSDIEQIYEMAEGTGYGLMSYAYYSALAIGYKKGLADAKKGVRS